MLDFLMVLCFAVCNAVMSMHSIICPGDDMQYVIDHFKHTDEWFCLRNVHSRCRDHFLKAHAFVSMSCPRKSGRNTPLLLGRMTFHLKGYVNRTVLNFSLFSSSVH